MLFLKPIMADVHQNFVLYYSFPFMLHACSSQFHLLCFSFLDFFNLTFVSRVVRVCVHLVQYCWYFYMLHSSGLNTCPYSLVALRIFH